MGRIAALSIPFRSAPVPIGNERAVLSTRASLAQVKRNILGSFGMCHEESIR